MANVVRHYRPLHIFCSASTSTSEPGACLVLLNRHLSGLETAVRAHWGKFSVVLCADGGANRLHDTAGADREKLLPHTVVGDLDSARPDVLKYYRDKGCRVVQVDDQDSTDFDKAVREGLALRERGLASFASIYALNALGERFDQTLANVQTLMLLQGELAATPLYLISEDSIAFLLPAGQSCVVVDSGLERGQCGLLPVGEPCSSCSTSGLRWNLSQQAMRFGGLVSTSNHLLPGTPAVQVTASSPLLWTMSHTLCSSS